MFDIIHDSVSLPKGNRACRRRAEELRAAHHLHHRLAAFAAEEHVAPRHTPLPGQRKLFNEHELEEKKSWLKDLSGDSQKALLRALEKLEEAGPWRNVAKAPEPAVLEGLNADYPNFAPVTKLIQQRFRLCRLSPHQELALPPILLNGPPGVGKTAYACALAELLGIGFQKIDLSSDAASFTVLGLDAGYGNAHPGLLWELLVKGGLSKVVLLDEIDKSNRTSKYGGTQYLLNLLEPVSSKRFVDNCTQVALDASCLCYVASCNYLEEIDKPLLSRFEVFDIQAPDAHQLRAVVRSIYRHIRQSEPWGQNFAERLDNEVIDALSELTPREVRRRLFDACATAAEQSRDHLQACDVKAKAVPHDKSERRIGFI